MACETPDVMVRLGSHLPSEMPAIGTTTQAVGFDISLNNCPAGLGRIQYRLDPTTAVLSAADSVIALDGSSSASGVGVQLLNDDGTTAFQLGKDQTFSDYDPSSGGSYVIPLKARYYRVGGAIAGGAANTSVTVTMQYQ
ncbi:type 1 fimbrial protein [Dyella agri]|uniref:Type 1 fimbrial protein n=2 Tax=Dyella agri TaxID=1926869 RepID=A0ABW8KLJ8_9GAMM